MSGRAGDWDLAFTGERVVPGKTPPFLVLEHLVRYRFAARSAAGCTVLDVGCGTGYGASILAAKARLVVGVDNAPEAIQYAQENYPGGNLRFAVADCRNLPYPDGSFDLAVMFEVIEHIAEQEQCLREIRRILLPDGILILSTPNAARSTKVIEEPNPYHAKELSEDELRELLRPHFAEVQLLYQQELSGSGIQAAASAAPGPADVVEDLSAASEAKYFVAVCGRRPAQVSMERALGVGGIDHQIAIVQDLRSAHRDIEALLRQREEEQREYAKNLTAHQRDLEAKQEVIEAFLRQREENERQYAKNLAAQAEIIHNQEQRIVALDRRLQEEIAVRDRQLAELESQNASRRMELEWLYRWIPVNKLARNLLYGRNLRRRLLRKLGLRS
jgi:SAM-dependent methyltransferase